MSADKIRVCPACGGHFELTGYKRRSKYCFAGCANRAAGYKSHHGTFEGLPQKVIFGSARWLELNDPSYGRAARLAKRDRAYDESPCAARVVVSCVQTTDGRTLVVETRGRSCIGCMSAGVIRSA